VSVLFRHRSAPPATPLPRASRTRTRALALRSASASAASAAPATFPLTAATPPPTDTSPFTPGRYAPPASHARRALTGAAYQIPLRSSQAIEDFRARASASGWQRQAFDAYESVGEVSYALNLVAKLLSRVRIYPGAITDPARPPTPVDSVKDLTPGLATAANAALARLSIGSDSGIGGILYDMALNISITGECYLVQTPEQIGSQIPETWTIRSTEELLVSPDARSFQLRSNRSSPPASPAAPRTAHSPQLQTLPPDAYVGRIFRSSARFSDEPFASLRSLLPLVEELLILNQMFRAAELSRLNAGLLYMPDGLSVAHTPGSTPSTVPAPLPPLPGEPTTPPPPLPGMPPPPAPTAAAEEDEFELDLIDAMVTPIQSPDSASSVVPLLIRGPAELGDKIKRITLDRSYDEQMVARAQNLLDRILAGIDVPKDAVQSLANVKYALSVDSEILTRAGWRTFEQVAVGDDVYTLNHDTGDGEWAPLLQVNIHEHDGPMLSMRTGTHSSLSTPEHRWATVTTSGRRRWTTSADGFTSTDRVQTAAACTNLPTTAKYSDGFVQLAALYMSDGWLESPPRVRARARARPRANILKTDGSRTPDVFSAVRAVLRTAGVSWAEYPGPVSRLSSRGRGRRSVRFRIDPDGTDALTMVAEGPEKVIRADFIADLTRAQLTLFLDTLIEIGDGNLVDGRLDIRRYWQTDPRRLEAIALAAVLTGYTVRWLPTPIRPGPRAGITTSRPCYGLTISKARTWFSPHASARHGNAQWEQYTGKVWCPTTRNRTWLARRDGTVFFTGNTNAIQIEESMLRTTLEPLALMICDALTRAYLRPYLQATGYTREQAQRIVLWFDPTDIINRPNRTEDANDGFDRYVLSASAWRAAHGFDESAAPDPAELVLRFLSDKGQVSPELTETLLKVIAPLTMEQARQANAETAQNPLPPEVQQALGLPPSAPPDATPPPPGAPAPNAPVAPAAPNAPGQTATPAPTPTPPTRPPTPGAGAPGV
jgi:hypothetical protein